MTRSVIRRAFTLFELLVVISIIILLAAIIVPAFGRIIESANYSGSINRVSGALGQARALAIQNGRHTGVAFFFDLETQVCSVQVLELHGQQSGTIGSDTPAMVFRPATGTVPIELPKGTIVYGMSFAVAPPFERWGNTADYQWYAGEMLDPDGSLDVSAGGTPEVTDDEVVPWLFPRNDPRVFIDPDIDEPCEAPNARNALRHCATFMIQFDPSGSIVTCTESGGECLINAYLEYPDDPFDPNSADDDPLDDEFLFDPEVADDENLDTCFPNEVVLRSASMLAVVQAARLSEGVGVREPWTIWSEDAIPHANNERVRRDEEKLQEIWDWIDLNAELLSFDRYTGGVIRRR